VSKNVISTATNWT